MVVDGSKRFTKLQCALVLNTPQGIQEGSSDKGPYRKGFIDQGGHSAESVLVSH